MGASQSVTDSTTEINRVNNFDFLNEQDLKTVTNNVFKSKNECISVASIDTKIGSNLKTKGTVKIDGIKNNTKAKADMTCLQKVTVQAEFRNQLYQDLANKLQNESNSAIVEKLKSAASNGFLSPGLANSKSSTNYKENNKLSTTVRNVLKNAIENNFTDETVSKCGSTTTNSFKLGTDMETEGDIIIENIDNDQAVEAISNCQQFKDATSGLQNELKQGMISDTENKQSSSKQTEQTATSENKGVDSYVTALFSGLSNLVQSSTGIFMIVGIIILVIIVMFGKDILKMFTGENSITPEAYKKFQGGIYKPFNINKSFIPQMNNMMMPTIPNYTYSFMNKVNNPNNILRIPNFKRPTIIMSIPNQ